MNRCYARLIGTGNPIRSESQLKALIECTPPETRSDFPTPTVSFNWAAPGETFVDANLCSTITAKVKYGVELRGWAFSSAASLNYGWSILSRRDRSAVCPRGYGAVNDTDGYPMYCIKPACATCETVGNPLSIASAEQKVYETDYEGRGASPLRFARSYSNFGYYRSRQSGVAQVPGFGDFWRHSYGHRVFAEGSANLLATAMRPNATEKHFRSDGKEALNIDGAGDLISTFGSGGWLYRARGGALETYGSDGQLLRIFDRQGLSQTLSYSDLSTPLTIAPATGLLIRVTDSFGRNLNFTYNSNSQLNAMIDPAGSIYQYVFNLVETLTRVDYPDGTFRTYTYNETDVFASAGGPYAISGIYDENGARFATYRYSDGYWHTPDSTEHAGGVEKFERRPNGPYVSHPV